MEKPSHIFTGFRALGFISNHVPLCVRYNQQHKENYVVTCVGKAFHIYNCSRLGLVSVSDVHPEPITCTAVDGIYVYTAYNDVIQAFTRGRKVKHTYRGHENNIRLMMPFGHHLISVDEASCVKVWDINSEEVFLDLQFDNTSFEITTMVHPNTYLNKVLFGSSQGTLQLWNLLKNKQLYNFTGWNLAVTTLEQAPAIDVIAVGLADGRVVLHNIRYDETLITFTQDWGPVTAISFRTDGYPIMVTGSTLGHIAVWNLEEKRLQSQMRQCHNSVVWIFDMPDGGGRLLNQRTGHSAPPSRVRYYGNQGDVILSAGQDSTLHSFSTLHESKNRSLGRASYNKKQSKKSGLKLDKYMMPPVTAFTAEPSRQSDWDSIVTCHRGEKLVMTWNYQRSTMGVHKLIHERFQDVITYKNVSAQCVDISSCGNFAVIGYSSGHVDLFNIQSGIHRGTYGNPTAHKGSVRGIAIDGLNQTTVTGGADQYVRFWKFKSKQLLDAHELPSQVAQILLHRESSMLAVALDSFDIIIMDTDTRRIVREFTGHHNSVTDMSFSADSRWLVTSSMDASVRTWDLPTGRLIDCFLVDGAVTSLTLSPTSDFLVTTHVDDLGVYLWSNMTLYTHVSLKPLPLDYEPYTIDMPSSGAISKEAIKDDEDELNLYEVASFKSPEQIADELERNKPKEPPKVPKVAPFFLPTIPGLQPQFAPVGEDEDLNEFHLQTRSRVIKGNFQHLSEFVKTLHNAASTNDFRPVVAFLKEMGPSAIDAELQSLAPEGGGSIELMGDFLIFINEMLKTNKNFELIQAYLGLFLKLHGDTLSREPSLIQRAKRIQIIQQETWHRIQDLFNQSSCLVTYVKSATM
ncbi:hypothetical protein LSH36_211g01051 [Paralvinella palmiformis]|uniref:Small-subunit processome Utp21 domain-containing protein n=1 Tax=Paralvinella palmiformis TaxID=53620 RepID=A0AAD9JNJ3_9ANNE|nr:hypothetical protein LSH36_211g01051 [Paralvinella palmiformis]